MNGASIAVRSPLRVSPRDEKAPYRSLLSIAADVPTAWAAVPIERPWAIGLFIRLSLTILKPAIPPNIPVQTTTAAVSEGIPPTADEISMAIGVVTALGASDIIISWEAPKSFANTTTDTIPATHPASSEISNGSNCFRIVVSCL